MSTMIQAQDGNPTMNEGIDSPKQMLCDHERWRAEHRTWRSEAHAWLDENAAAIRRLQHQIDAHRGQIAEHLKTIRMSEQRSEEHEDAIKRYNRGEARLADREAMVNLHKAQAIHQQSQLESHERTKKQHALIISLMADAAETIERRASGSAQDRETSEAW